IPEVCAAVAVVPWTTETTVEASELQALRPATNTSPITRQRSDPWSRHDVCITNSFLGRIAPRSAERPYAPSISSVPECGCFHHAQQAQRPTQWRTQWRTQSHPSLPLSVKAGEW